MLSAKEFELLKVLNRFHTKTLDELQETMRCKLHYKPLCGESEVAPLLERLTKAGYVADMTLTEKGDQVLSACRVNSAFIMAAGGTEVTAKTVYSLPKGLYKVNGELLIERQIRQLREAGIDDIYVVVGYKKDMYFYLEKKFGIKLVVNPNPKKNNVYSLFAIADLIGSSYICNCDNYYPENPFDKYEYHSYHTTVRQADTASEIMVRTNSDRRITGLYTGKESGECLYGHSFFDSEFSRKIAAFVKAEIDVFRVDSLFWEEFYARHMDELDMYARCYDKDFLWEFDSIQEIQNLDSLFIENVGDTIMEKICSVLQCKAEDILNVEISNKGLSNILFTFVVSGQKYIFRFPGGSTSNIITTRKKEVMAQKLATKAGIDDTLVYVDDSGCKIAKFIENCKDISGLYYQDDAFMARLAEKVGALHRAGRELDVPREYWYDPIAEADRLLTMACETKGDLFSSFGEMRAKVAKIYEYCEKDGIAKTICHNDINADNVLVTDTSFDIIDYEFGGYNDPGFDFGRILGSYDYDSKSIDVILAAYFGRPATAVERRHYIAYVAIHDWYYFCWCLYKESINEDTREWMLYFNGILNRVIDYVLPQFEKED